MKDKFLCIAHRGASFYEPENTLRAFKRAIEMGCDGIELDVRRSKDGKVVVIHDESVDRTTNGKGKVSEMTLEELKKLDAGKGEKIPLLEEVLQQINSPLYFVEIKEQGYESEVVNVVKNLGKMDEVVFISSNQESLKRVNKSGGKHLGLILTSATKAKLEYALPHFSLVNRIILSQFKGSKVIPWVINDVETLERMIGLGVDGIVTDKPDLMKQLKRIIKKTHLSQI